MSEDNPVSTQDMEAAMTGTPAQQPASTQAQTQTQPAEQQGPDLTVQDLKALKAIIDVASQRGVFKPNEMMTVGQTYTKLETFLAAVEQQQPQGA